MCRVGEWARPVSSRVARIARALPLPRTDSPMLVTCTSVDVLKDARPDDDAPGGVRGFATRLDPQLHEAGALRRQRRREVHQRLLLGSVDGRRHRGDDAARGSGPVRAARSGRGGATAVAHGPDVHQTARQHRHPRAVGPLPHRHPAVVPRPATTSAGRRRTRSSRAPQPLAGVRPRATRPRAPRTDGRAPASKPRSRSAVHRRVPSTRRPRRRRQQPRRAGIRDVGHARCAARSRCSPSTGEARRDRGDPRIARPAAVGPGDGEQRRRWQHAALRRLSAQRPFRRRRPRSRSRPRGRPRRRLRQAQRPRSVPSRVPGGTDARSGARRSELPSLSAIQASNRFSPAGSTRAIRARASAEQLRQRLRAGVDRHLDVRRDVVGADRLIEREADVERRRRRRCSAGAGPTRGAAAASASRS